MRRIVPILQSEAAECGLACLAMIACWHGQHTNLRELRTRFPLALHGVNLARLIDVAGQLGFTSRPLRLELDDLPKLALPCILHWNFNHFVVLARLRRDGAIIVDPASGERCCRSAELSERFTGVALELRPGAHFARRAALPAVALRDLTGPVSGLAPALAAIALLSLSLQACVVLGPFYLQWVVDQVLVAADRDLLVVLALGFALLALLQVGIFALRGWSIAFLAARLGAQWLSNVVAHLLRLPLEFFERRHLGDIVSRLGAVQAMQRTLTGSCVEVLIDGLMAVATLAMMLLYSVPLAAVSLLVVAAYLVLRIGTLRALRTGTEGQLFAAATQQTHLLESIRGIRALRTAGCEDARHAGFLNRLNETVNREFALARLALLHSGAAQVLFGLERVTVIWLGASLVLRNEFSVGMLMAYLAYREQFALRIAGLIDKSVELRMLRLHGERLADIALAEPEPRAGGDALPAGGSGVDVHVEGLSYRYA
ncbi:MAG: cysteine peptidase family C39 domain-containing protein, partial [Steroidobacteraceae bacterium]|nr:cysteine peptidase family C39 domain-containing protein [Steroidobacteraceae bacterium]MDW8257867.1 cysteine peptidase family C39 domain-containing protein [Gammaproteobacteria bacterium]